MTRISPGEYFTPLEHHYSSITQADKCYRASEPLPGRLLMNRTHVNHPLDYATAQRGVQWSREI